MPHADKWVTAMRGGHSISAMCSVMPHLCPSSVVKCTFA